MIRWVKEERKINGANIMVSLGPIVDHKGPNLPGLMEIQIIEI